MAEKKNVEEEEKKQKESKKQEEKEDTKKEEDNPSEDSKEEERKFEYKVFMHCEGCAKKLKKSLRGFQGVEDVVTDCKGSKVVVKGKTVDPLKVLDRLQHKIRRKVEILTQLPEIPAEDVKKAEEVKEKAQEEEKKEEIPLVVVTLKVHMHCEACTQGIKKTIQRMKGVESTNPNLKSSQVVVKGFFAPQELVDYVYKKVGKHAEIVKQETEKKEEEKKDVKKGGEEDKGEEETKVEVKQNEFYYYYPKYSMDCLYPPQIFSDENPNACSVM